MIIGTKMNNDTNFEIEYVNSDITEVYSGLTIHGVNCQGAFGSGVAGAIRRKYPEVYEAFKKCPTGKQMLGEFIPVNVDEYPNLIIGNCYTQEYYGSDGKVYASLEAIRESLTKAFLYATLNDIYSVNMPKIGAGLGGLNWNDVEGVITDVYSNFSKIFKLRIYYI